MSYISSQTNKQTNRFKTLPPLQGRWPSHPDRPFDIFILREVAQLFEKSHFKRLTIGKWPWGSLKVIENGARPYITSY